MLSKHKYFVYDPQSPKTIIETFIISYKSSLIVFFSTNLVFCIFIFIMWSFIFNYKFFSYSKKTIINYFFIIYLVIIGFMITNFFVYKLIWNDYYFTGSIRLGYKSAGHQFKSFINSYWTINSKTRSMSFFFSMLSFLFFNSFIYKIYISKEEWNFNKIYFIPLLMIAQVALTTLLFAKNFIVIYTSIELFSMIMYYVIIFESTNYKTKFNNNIYNTELSLKYFIISLFGSINILIGISFIFYSIGSLNFNTIQLYFVPDAEGLEFFTGTGIKFGFITFIIGLLIKMGIAPYHFWINGIYDRFSNSFFEYMSIFPKSIIICFILNIFSTVTLSYPNYGYLGLNDFFSVVGILNIIIGTFSSINQTDMKRIIMYSSLSNIGYIFIAIGANYQTFSVAYSYIIHYTIALFILFRVLNHIEIDQKFSFKQWYFAEFSSLSIKNKIFMTIAIFNISGLPPFAIFFNKFYILAYLWNNEAYISFIIMIIFSVISYSYYFNIIKYIWFNEKFSSFTAYNAFKKNIRFDNMFNSNKTGNDILEYLGWNEPDIEMGEESDPDNFTYDNYAKIVKSTSIYENWVKTFCFEIEKVITRMFIFSTFIGFFSVAYTIAYFKFIKLLDWNVGKVWVRTVWVKRIKMAIQLFISAGGMPKTKKNNFEAMKADVIKSYYSSYISKFDYFTKWVAETSVGEKNRLIIVHSDYWGISKISTPDQRTPILIDTASKIIYMINKYFISNFIIASFCIIGFYFWLSVNGKFRNIFLSLTLLSKVFKTMFQICVAFFIALIINAYNVIMQNYFEKHKIRHYYQIKKYKKYGMFLSSVVVVISFILAVTSIVVIAIEITNFISISNLFIAMIFLNFYLKLLGITPEHDWNFENMVRTTLSVKKLFRDFFVETWAKDNPKYSWFAQLRTRRPWFNPNKIIKIKKKIKKNGTSN